LGLGKPTSRWLVVCEIWLPTHYSVVPVPLGTHRGHPHSSCPAPPRHGVRRRPDCSVQPPRSTSKQLTGHTKLLLSARRRGRRGRRTVAARPNSPNHRRWTEAPPPPHHYTILTIVKLVGCKQPPALPADVATITKLSEGDQTARWAIRARRGERLIGALLAAPVGSGQCRQAGCGVCVRHLWALFLAHRVVRRM
jgi:hypothetical protein